MTPIELQYLRDLRRRGQAPDLAVFITDDWKFAGKITNEIGSMMIRVSDGGDSDYDWSPLAGLWVILWLKRATEPQIEAFIQVIFEARAQKVWARTGGRLMPIVRKPH